MFKARQNVYTEGRFTERHTGGVGRANHVPVRQLKLLGGTRGTRGHNETFLFALAALPNLLHKAGVPVPSDEITHQCL